MNRILELLNGQGKHISFHTPGHKRAGPDITELSYSDNLFSPSGVLKNTEREIAEILGADRSFLLTDGSTCGVYSALYCLKLRGAKRIAAPVFSHPSVRRACQVMGLEIVPMAQEIRYGIPRQPKAEEMERAIGIADAMILTSPDYYGYFAPMERARALCKSGEKPLLIDGAHGGHLHFTSDYAGRFADIWVDGVHKSLPALTQGAVVSAKGEWADTLLESVKYFRTTSPSYPIMASVEYAVKYPRNERIERKSEAFKRAMHCVENDDWTKILVPFGKEGLKAMEFLEQNGVYAEFFDGNYLLFYLSPCSKDEEIEYLAALILDLPRGKVAKDAPCGQIPMYEE